MPDKTFTPHTISLKNSPDAQPVFGKDQKRDKQARSQVVEQEKRAEPLPGSTPVPQPMPEQADSFASHNPVQPTSAAPVVSPDTHKKPGSKQSTGMTPTNTPVPKPVSQARKTADAEKKEAARETPGLMDGLMEVVEVGHNVAAGNPGAVLVGAKDIAHSEDEHKENNQKDSYSKIASTLTSNADLTKLPTPTPAHTSTQKSEEHEKQKLQEQPAGYYVRPPVNHEMLTTISQTQGKAPAEPEVAEEADVVHKTSFGK
jgi:hypothetical protein